MDIVTAQQESIAPMFTVDGVEMVKDMVVFRPFSDYRGTFVEKSTIIALSRVNRYFILKCAKGCETKVKLTDGCARGTSSEIPYFSMDLAIKAATEARKEGFQGRLAYLEKQTAELKQEEARLNTVIDVR